MSEKLIYVYNYEIFKGSAGIEIAPSSRALLVEITVWRSFEEINPEKGRR
jgi:hypothetical protein